MTTNTKKDARVAGFLYLLLVLVGPFRLQYLPNVLFLPGQAAATATNIAGHELLFRMGILSDMLAGVLSLILALALYRLFEPVDRLARRLLGDAEPAARLGGGGPAQADRLECEGVRRAHIGMTAPGQFGVQLVDDRPEPAEQQQRQLEAVGVS